MEFGASFSQMVAADTIRNKGWLDTVLFGSKQQGTYDVNGGAVFLLYRLNGGEEQKYTLRMTDGP